MTRKIDFDALREIALKLPGVSESTIHGLPSLKVRGKLLACVPVRPSAEPDSIAVRIGFDQRAQLMAASPKTYYLTDHYRDYPTLLVRLTRIRLKALEDLMSTAWTFVTDETKSRKSRKK